MYKWNLQSGSVGIVPTVSCSRSVTLKVKYKEDCIIFIICHKLLSTKIVNDDDDECDDVCVIIIIVCCSSVK